MKRLLIAIIAAISLLSCTDMFMDEPALPTTSSDINQANNDTTNVVPKDNGPDPSETYPFPGNSCVQCQWYFCPPLDSVWQKEICIDHCQDPPTVVHEGECKEYLQCDPTQYHMAYLDCVTDDGYPGTQEQVCNKGQI